MEAPKYPVGSVDRALRLLLILRDQKQIRLSDAADLLGVSHSTAHRLLDMLRFHGFVDQDEETSVYYLGSSLMDLGLMALRSFNIVQETRPYLESLARTVNETSHLVVLRGTNTVFLDVALPSRGVHTTSRVGATIPAHATSGGKALLATLPLTTLRSLYPDPTLPRLTENSVAKRSDLEDELAEIRRVGFAVNFGESESEIGAVAVVLRDRMEEVRGALAVTVPMSRFGEDEASAIAPIAARVAESWSMNVPSRASIL